MENLLEEYENLTSEEKNSLLIYKSRLGRAINSLDNNYQEIEDIYYKYKKLLSKKENIFMAFPVFKDISFDSIDSFIESLATTKEIVKNVNMKLKEELTVYRAYSIPNNQEEMFLSRSELVSTSLEIDNCDNFLINDDNYNHYLYKINLEKGSLVTACPYSILLDGLTERLTLSKNNTQEEVILNKENYDFEVIKSTTRTLEDGSNLEIKTINGSPKEKRHTRKV